MSASFQQVLERVAVGCGVVFLLTLLIALFTDNPWVIAVRAMSFVGFLIIGVIAGPPRHDGEPHPIE